MNQSNISKLMLNFPKTRYMGSKYKILPSILKSVEQFDFDTILDAFGGSNCVGYLFKKIGKNVFSNDILEYSHQLSKALIENTKSKLTKSDVEFLINNNSNHSNFINNTFGEIYFSKSINNEIENIRSNINQLDDEYKKAIAISSLNRSCLKKRPRGVFTYIGNRYDDGRLDLQKSLIQHFTESVDIYNKAVIDNNKNNKSFNKDIFDIETIPDLVYFDPPYLSTKSDNDYLRRYHFIEGLSKEWRDIEIQEHTLTKKFKSYPTLFSSKSTIEKAFKMLFEKFSKSIIVLSYSSNSIPNKESLINILQNVKKNVDVIEINHTYSFGTHNNIKNNESNKVKEYIFVGY